MNEEQHSSQPEVEVPSSYRIKLKGVNAEGTINCPGCFLKLVEGMSQDDANEYFDNQCYGIEQNDPETDCGVCANPLYVTV